MKVAIIGAGNMGGAIARGMATGSIIKAEEIVVTAHTQATLDKLKADIPAINTTLNTLTKKANIKNLEYAITRYPLEWE